MTANEDRYLRFWQSQSRSLHREDDAAFYARKAQEHATLMGEDAGEPVADFACGAGELLEEMLRLVRVEAASDFAASMLGRARRRLDRSSVELIHADGLTHARSAGQAVWTTCGGLNQYLAPALLREWIEIFAESSQARSLYLFDCVDPARYRTLRAESRYNREPASTAPRIRRRLWAVSNALSNTTHRGWADLGSAAMGYGYSPAFIRRLAADAGLGSRFCSSREYEYRFHAILRKR